MYNSDEFSNSGDNNYSNNNDGMGGEDDNQLAKFVKSEDYEKALVMKGLPFRVQMDEIIEFFDGYGSVTEDKIIIEENGGRRTGMGAIIFESNEMAQSAKNDKNRQEIGPHGRWVMLCDENDGFFKKAMNI